jgi:putative addiction module component (TIGR02574 family)
MSAVAEQLKSQLELLPVADRAELAHYLLSSLEPEEDGVADAWREEITRRVAEIRSGTATGTPATEFLKELREKYP